MTRLLSALIAVSLAFAVQAADATKAAPTEAKAAPAGEQLVTPQSNAAALKAAIDDKKNAAKSAKGEKPAEAKK